MAVLKSRKNINNKKPWATRYSKKNTSFFLSNLKETYSKKKKNINSVFFYSLFYKI